MEKPKDYDVYFYPDGSDKEAPEGMSFAERLRWYRRQNAIELSLMSEEEREKFLERRIKMYRRWACESGHSNPIVYFSYSDYRFHLKLQNE